MFDIDDRSVPKTFRELVLADLRRACRLMRRIDDEIDLQFRIASPEGDWWLALTLPPDAGARHHCMQCAFRGRRPLVPAHGDHRFQGMATSVARGVRRHR